jgi:hypothetical protein
VGYDFSVDEFQLICVGIVQKWYSQKGTSLIVVIEQVIDGFVNRFVFSPDMKGQIDTIEILVEKQGLISVEWETLDEVSTKFGTRRSQDLFSDSSGDDFIGFSRRVWSDVLVKWEDLFEEGIDTLGL